MKYDSDFKQIMSTAGTQINQEVKLDGERKLLHDFFYMYFQLYVFFRYRWERVLIMCVRPKRLQYYGLEHARLLCSRDSPGKGCHALLQGIFLTQGIEPASPASLPLAGGFFTTSTTWEALRRVHHVKCQAR